MALSPTNAFVCISLVLTIQPLNGEMNNDTLLLSFCRPRLQPLERWQASGRSNNAPAQAQGCPRMPLAPLASGTTLRAISLPLLSLRLPLCNRLPLSLKYLL